MNVMIEGQGNHKPLAIALVATGVVALSASLLLISHDHDWSQASRQFDIPGDLRKAIELSEAFAHGSGAAAILIAMTLATWPPSLGLWRAIIMTVASGITANLLKVVFTRARPYTYDEVPSAAATDVTGWQFLGDGSLWDASHRSFPSGHTATAWGLAIGLSLLYPRAAFVFLLLACLSTFQRIYSGAHFPSDTLAGFGVACICCSLTLLLHKRPLPQS